MNRYFIIIIAVVVIAIALVFAFKALPQNNREQPIETNGATATTTATSTTQKNTAQNPPNSSNKQTPTAPSATQRVPATDVALSTGLQQAFITKGSYRCVWVDKTTGADSLALIKNGRVRLESTSLTGEKTTILYTAAATYMWKEGEQTGVLVPKQLSPSTQLNALPTYTDLEAKLRTDSRVKCEQVTINDSHFIVPTNITFQAIQS